MLFIVGRYPHKILKYFILDILEHTFQITLKCLNKTKIKHMKQLVKERQFSCRIIVIYMYNGLYKLEQRTGVAGAS